MESLITAAARALAAGDPLGALNRVALGDDPPALALRGIAMAPARRFRSREGSPARCGARPERGRGPREAQLGDFEARRGVADIDVDRALRRPRAAQGVERCERERATPGCVGDQVGRDRLPRPVEPLAASTGDAAPIRR